MGSRSEADALDFRQAVAYVKGIVPEDDASPVVKVADDCAPVMRKLCEGLLVAYLVEEGRYFRYVQGHHLKEAGITRAELDELAIENLRSTARGRVVVDSYGPVMTARLDGNLEAGLLLLDEFWDVAMRDHVGSSPIVAVPSRDVIAFCSGDSAAGRAELRAVISRVWSGGDHLVSDSLLSRRDGRWSPVR